tara:strand:+ start:76 stop:975 length:900 start_codon:yes stop_codon:yes gene_type:complete
MSASPAMQKPFQSKITDGVGSQVQLSISPDQIGFFVGPKGKNIRNHIVAKSISQYKEQNNIADDVKIPIFVQIRHPDEENPEVHAVIEVDKDHGHIIPFIEDSIGKHQTFFLKNQVKKVFDKKVSEKPKNCRIVFKTKMEHFMIGKYVGGGGKNIVEVCRDCQDAIADITKERIRINIEPDKKMNMKSVGKFFYIKNSEKTDQSVLIIASIRGEVDVEKVFRKIKKIMIDSVVNMFKPRKYEEENEEYDFLCGGSCKPSEMTLESKEAGDFLNSIEDECYDPGSPGYDPNSPRYSPSSP